MRLVRGLAVVGVLAFVGCGDDNKNQMMPPGGDDAGMMTPMLDALRVSSFPLKAARSGEAFSYRGLLSKPGLATWSLSTAPGGATVDMTGVVSWTPSDSQGGDNAFTLHAELNGES